MPIGAGPATTVGVPADDVVTTIRRAELHDSETQLTRVNDQTVRRTLEEAGVEFIDEDENGERGPGVRLRQRPI